MGDNQPAIKEPELAKILLAFGVKNRFEIVKTSQLDPDTSIYEIQENGRRVIILETDYVSDVEDVTSRYEEYLKESTVLMKVIDPPEAFDYEPYLRAKPEYFTKDGDDFNRLRLYQFEYQPVRYRYALKYFAATVTE